VKQIDIETVGAEILEKMIVDQQLFKRTGGITIQHH